MTEEEAKTKWCPFARIPFYATSGTLTVNRDRSGSVAARCVGSECMAWRQLVEALNTGFCGLAGSP